MIVETKIKMNCAAFKVLQETLNLPDKKEVRAPLVKLFRDGDDEIWVHFPDHDFHIKIERACAPPDQKPEK